MNKEAMLAVADVIEWADKKFDMAHFAFDPNLETEWGKGEDISDPNDLWNKCGTIGCIWGWTNAWADLPLDDEDAAAEELGLDPEEAQRLFYWDKDSVWYKLADEFGWDKCDPTDSWSYANGLADPEQVTAKQAAKVLRLIAKGKVKL